MTEPGRLASHPRTSADDDGPRALALAGASTRAQERVIAASLALLIAAFSALPTRAHAEDVPSAKPDPGLAREQWRGHVRETKRRVQQEAAQPRLERAHSRAEPSQEDVARRASESV